MRRLLPGLLLLLSGCGGSPTAPGPLPAPSVDLRPPDPALYAIAMTWWPRQAACVGVEERVLGHQYRVDVVEEAFDCGGVSAAGCFYGLRIAVVRRWFEAALSHEYIHLALWKKGESIGHDNPAFPRCDVLNYAGSASRAAIYQDGAAWEKVQ